MSEKKKYYNPEYHKKRYEEQKTKYKDNVKFQRSKRKEQLEEIIQLIEKIEDDNIKLLILEKIKNI